MHVKELVAQAKQNHNESMCEAPELTITSNMTQEEAAAAIAYMTGHNGTCLNPLIGSPTEPRQQGRNGEHIFYVAEKYVRYGDVKGKPPIPAAEYDGTKITEADGWEYELKKVAYRG